MPELRGFSGDRTIAEAVKSEFVTREVFDAYIQCIIVLSFNKS